MRISELVMVILVTSLFIIGGSLYVADVGYSYGVSGTPNLAALNQTAEIASAVSTMQTTMLNTTTGNVILDVANSAWNFIGFMSSAFIRTGLLFLSTPTLFTNMLSTSSGTGLLDRIGIPAWISGIIIIMIISAVTFAVYRTVAKSDI